MSCAPRQRPSTGTLACLHSRIRERIGAKAGYPSSSPACIGPPSTINPPNPSIVAGTRSPSWGNKITSSAPRSTARSPASPIGVTGQCCRTSSRISGSVLQNRQLRGIGRKHPALQAHLTKAGRSASNSASFSSLERWPMDRSVSNLPKFGKGEVPGSDLPKIAYGKGLGSSIPAARITSTAREGRPSIVWATPILR